MLPWVNKMQHISCLLLSLVCISHLTLHKVHGEVYSTKSTCRILKSWMFCTKKPCTSFMHVQFCVPVLGCHTAEGQMVWSCDETSPGSGEKLFITRTKSPVWEAAEQLLMGAQQRVLQGLTRFLYVSSANASFQRKEVLLERSLLSPSSIFAFVEAIGRKSGVCCWGSCHHPAPQRHHGLSSKVQVPAWGKRRDSLLQKGFAPLHTNLFALLQQNPSLAPSLLTKPLPGPRCKEHGEVAEATLGGTDHFLNRWLGTFHICLCTWEDSPPCISLGSYKSCACLPWYTFHVYSYKCQFSMYNIRNPKQMASLSSASSLG